MVNVKFLIVFNTITDIGVEVGEGDVPLAELLRGSSPPGHPGGKDKNLKSMPRGGAKIMPRVGKNRSGGNFERAGPNNSSPPGQF